MHGIFGEPERAHNHCICTSHPSQFTTCTLEPRRLYSLERYSLGEASKSAANGAESIEARNPDACAVARHTDEKTSRSDHKVSSPPLSNNHTEVGLDTLANIYAERTGLRSTWSNALRDGPYSSWT